MKIYINALSASSGGGISVAVAYANFLCRAEIADRIAILLCPKVPAQAEIAERLKDSNCQIIEVGGNFFHPFRRTLLERRLLKSLFQQDHGSEILLIQLNGLLPLGPQLNAKKILLVQDPSAYVSSTYGNARSRFGSLIRRQVQRFSLPRADAAIYTSNYIKKLISSKHRRLPPINEVVFNGLEEIAGKKESVRIEPSRGVFRIVTVSNVAQYKGQDDVIKAIGILKRTKDFDKEICYDIVGGIRDEERARLMAIIEKEKLTGNVSVHGRVSDSERDEILEQADLFVHLSRCESFGIPIIEAMNEGLPVLAASRTALPEIGGSAAEYCDPDDLEEVAEKIASLAKDPKRRAQMIDKGFENVERFTWEKVIASVCSVVASINSHEAK